MQQDIIRRLLVNKYFWKQYLDTTMSKASDRRAQLLMETVRGVSLLTAADLTHTHGAS